MTKLLQSLCDELVRYRTAGSFVLYLTERFGLEAVLRFFSQAGGRDESLTTIRARMQSVFGESLEETEGAWLDLLRG